MPCGFFAHLTSLFLSIFYFEMFCGLFLSNGYMLLPFPCVWCRPYTDWMFSFVLTNSNLAIVVSQKLFCVLIADYKLYFLVRQGLLQVICFWWLLKRDPFSPSPASRRILGPVDPPQFWEKQGKKSGKSQNKTWRRQRVRGTAPLESASGARVAQ